VAPPFPPEPAATDELSLLLERAGRYVAGYASAFRNVSAEELYEQEFIDPGRHRTVRRSRADVVFMSLPGDVPWTVFRDVVEVDGRPVGDREARLRLLFAESPDTAVEKARRVLEESSRYNLGPLRRTVNFPTLALTFLLPENQPRFAFERKGRRTVRGTDAVEVEYTEKARPTIVRDDSGYDVRSRGRFWIDPETGGVVRTVLEHDPNGHDWLAWARIAVEYRREPRLDILVPDSMRETYGTPEYHRTEEGAAYNPTPSRLRRAPTIEQFSIDTEARYSSYGQFKVETQEFFRPAPEASPKPTAPPP
jgi:hypothetical protein